MGVLDNETIYEKFDPQGMNKYIHDLPNHIENSWNELKQISIPTHYINAKNIVILGMGGSGNVGNIIKYYTQKNIKVPIEIVKDYVLPAYVNSSTLVIAISFSGGTEETIAAFSEAGVRGAKLLAVSAGGEIESLARKYNVPHFKINYSLPARAAIIFLLMPIIYFLSKLKFIDVRDDEINEILNNLKIFQQRIEITMPTGQNEAKKLAENLKGKLCIIVGSGIVSPIAVRFKNQINENAKSFAAWEEMPEMCHNFLQGLDFPDRIKDKILTIFIQSKFDYPRNILRFQAVQNVLKRKGLMFEVVNLEVKGSELSEILHYLHFVDYVSLYMAMLEQTDPMPYEMVTYLKNFLAENK
ncbi:MAG: hypothetical protein ACD_58C00037G0001 [uncultured bacterium]|nr:MAG: hypothetical protein ACD_58C00037G0001 [uncultured bacterium]